MEVEKFGQIIIKIYIGILEIINIYLGFWKIGLFFCDILLCIKLNILP